MNSPWWLMMVAYGATLSRKAVPNTNHRQPVSRNEVDSRNFRQGGVAKLFEGQMQAYKSNQQCNEFTLLLNGSDVGGPNSDMKEPSATGSTENLWSELELN